MPQHELFGIGVVQLHPERSRVKLRFLLQSRRLFKIPVYRKNRVILIDLKDIVRFQGDGHETTIVTKEDRYLSNLSSADLALRLDNDVYLRVHRSHIVSLPYAVELIRSDESVNLVMDDDAELRQVPVSRPKKRAIEGTAWGGLARASKPRSGRARQLNYHM